MARYWKRAVATAAILAMLSCSTRQTFVVPNGPATLHPGAVNINIATVDELEKLPHVGRKTAEAIVEFRTENGPFRRVEHLMQIRGISEKRLTELRQFLKTE